MSNHSIFSVIGIEIEYMIVDKDSLSIQPKSDLILRAIAGKQVNEVALGDIALSNEFVMHVIELKNNGPKSLLEPIADHFQQTIINLQPLLEEHHLQLLPTGAHPWMNPATETHRWPHGNNAIYKQYDQIFNCNGHGWSNLQSMHINLPFANDEEFCQLHNSIRLLLPLLPALAASTPILDGKNTGLLDARLQFYSSNQRRIPSISGDIIPDFVTSQAQYEQEILEPMYKDIAPQDPNGLLQYEWLNSRGAIAKFDSMAVEIRIIDTQECVDADIAIANAIHAILKRWHDSGIRFNASDAIKTEQLKPIYDKTIKHGLSVTVDDADVLAQWQLPTRKSMTVGDIWTQLIEEISPELDLKSQHALEHILSQGNLSQRILKACGSDFSQKRLLYVYKQLGNCLLDNQQFIAS